MASKSASRSVGVSSSHGTLESETGSARREIIASSNSVSDSVPSASRRASTPVISRRDTLAPLTGKRYMVFLGFRRLAQRKVVLPALVLQLNVLEGDRVAARIEIGKRLILGDPAAMHDVAMYRLAFLVQQFDANLFAEIFQRLGSCPFIEHLRGIGPIFEILVVSHAALERNRFIPRPAQALANDRVSALFVFNHVRAAF